MLPYLVIGLFLLGVVALIALAVLLSRWRVRMPEFEVYTPDTFPADQFEVLRPIADQLEANGLLFVGLQRETRNNGTGVWQALFRSPDGTVWGVAERVGRSEPRIVFHSFFEEGRCVTTSQGEFADYDVTGEWRLHEQQWDHFDAQVTFHRRAVLGGGTGVAQVYNWDEFQGRYLNNAQRQFNHLHERGYLRAVPQQTGVFKVVPWREPAIALKMIFHSSRNQLAERSRKLEGNHQKELDAERAERERYGKIGEYKYLEYYKEDKKRGSSLQLIGWTPTGAILFFSIALLIAFFYARGAIDGTSVGIIAGVLVFHELGHIAAMMVFGYRDLHVLFIPGLARLVPERNIRVPSWKEFVVLLMGPLPGLLIGWSLLVVAYFNPALPPFWREVGFWAALINNLNFLAVLPADGGRVINLLIFERVPALRVIYLVASGVSVILYVIIYFLVRDTVPWPILVVLVSTFLALPDNWRHARMSPWAKHNLRPDDSESDALMKAFQIVEVTDSTRGLEKRGWTNFVDRVVRYGCSRKMGFWASAVCFVLFFSFLYTPVVVVVGLAIGDGALVTSQSAKLNDQLEDLPLPPRKYNQPLERTTRLALDQLFTTHRNRAARELVAEMKGDDYFDSVGEPVEESDLKLIRSIDWRQASAWLAEEESIGREEFVMEILHDLVAAAEAGIDAEEFDGPLSDLSKASLGLMACEPRSSLGVWIDWIYLEEAFLQQLDRVSSRRPLAPHQLRWFVRYLEEAPEPAGRKLAALLLHDLQAEGAQGSEISAADLGGNRKDFLQSAVGFRLRLTQADRELGIDKEEKGLFELGDLIDSGRLLRGLPTAEDYRAGLIVAESWAEQDHVGNVPLDKIENADQGKRWQARHDAIQRVVHYRKLAAIALRMGAHGIQKINAGGREETSEIPLKIHQSNGEVQLATTAPDGTELFWHLTLPAVQLR